AAEVPDAESFTLHEGAPLGLGALPPRDGQHQEVEPLGAVRLVARRENGVEDQYAGARRGGRSDRAQDRGGAYVVPVVEDRPEDVGVAGRDALEEAPLDELDPLLGERRLVAPG